MKTYQQLFEAKKIPSNKVLVVIDKEDDEYYHMVIPQNMIGKILVRDPDLLQGWDEEWDDIKEFAKDVQKGSPKAKNYFKDWGISYFNGNPKGLHIPLDEVDIDSIKDLADQMELKKNEMFIVDYQEYEEMK